MFTIFRRRKRAPLIVNIIDEDYVKNFVYQWSIQFPIDHWWRTKHKVAFNSLQHRSISFIDIKIEYEEDKLFKELREEVPYTPNCGDYMKPNLVEAEDMELSEEERKIKYIKEFESIDLSQYNDPV